MKKVVCIRRSLTNCDYSNHSCSPCLCSSSHCRWSFHWQSLLPATDHRSFYHSSWSPGSLLWLLEAAGCWIHSSHLPVCTRGTSLLFFPVRLSGPPFNPGDGHADPKLSLFDQSTGEQKKKKKKFYSIAAAENRLTFWPRGSKLLSLFPLLSDQIVTSEESNFYMKQYSDFMRNVQLRLRKKLGWTLVFLIAIHLNSSLRAYLRRMWMSNGVLPNTALQ